MEYVKRDAHEPSEINALNAALMQSHQKIGEAFFAPSQGAQNNMPLNTFDTITDIYSVMHFVLQMLRGNK
jgi:hypothetical protein